MKERPILFNSEMVKAILAGRKTQTRRVVKPQPTQTEIAWHWAGPRPKAKGGTGAIAAMGSDPLGSILKHLVSFCPYGQVGDRLWVKETFYAYGIWRKNGTSKTGKQKWAFSEITIAADGVKYKYQDDPPKEVLSKKTDGWGWYKRPSLFMEKEASRITLEITDVRVERLNSISPEDAIAEGIVLHTPVPGDGEPNPVLQYEHLWEEINGKNSWELNPFVWVIEFEKINQKR